MNFILCQGPHPYEPKYRQLSKSEIAHLARDTVKRACEQSREHMAQIKAMPKHWEGRVLR